LTRQTILAITVFVPLPLTAREATLTVRTASERSSILIVTVPQKWHVNEQVKHYSRRRHHHQEQTE
jgi:hypothetical protein